MFANPHRSLRKITSREIPRFKEVVRQLKWSVDVKAHKHEIRRNILSLKVLRVIRICRVDRR